MARHSQDIEGMGVQATIALVFGVVLTVVGLSGPVIGGAESELLGLFGRNYLHDVIHIASGGVGLAAGLAAGSTAAERYNRYLGGVYLLVFVLGSGALLAGVTSLTGLINLNWADNGLHLLVGITLAGLGYGLGGR